MPDTIYFVAGESSGDNHGAALLRALRQRAPNIQFAGRGGAKMKAIAGNHFRDWAGEAAVVGLWEVMKRYRFFRRQFRQTIAEIATVDPMAVVLIDYPGFNLRLAPVLRRKCPRTKLIYYISPQVWAWNQRRVGEMAKCLDLMLCIFPFEPAIYKEAGLNAVFVGHPLGFRKNKETQLNDDDRRDMNLVALFPGSREREVRKIFPIMREAALSLLRRRPATRFVIAAASDPLGQLIRAQLSKDKLERFMVAAADVHQLMRGAGAGMIASGTATLEAALAHLPFVLVYRVAWLTYFAARLVIRVEHLGMPNILAGREIVPEFIQAKARPAEIAAAVEQLLSNPTERQRMLSDFDSIGDRLDGGDASARAAAEIVAELNVGK